MNRQSFLHLTGAGLAGTALLPIMTGCSSNPRGSLSLQLYTVRDAIAKDLEGTIRKVADIGFKYVETAFWPEGVTVQQAAAVIRDAGLKVSSCHTELPLGEYKRVFVDTAQAFDCKKMIWHGWPEDKRYGTLEGTKELISVYNEAAAFAKSAGLEFGLHNHWWEFRNKVEGRPVYELLLEETDPSVFFEIDTYWVKVAGLVPAEIIKQFGRRATLFHIKDGPAVYNDNLLSDNPDPMTSVGKGTQDIPSIISAAEHADFFVVEMDRVEGDVFEKVKESYEYLRGNLGLR
jgi:sugar phosphate isomerase/epimerase